MIASRMKQKKYLNQNQKLIIKHCSEIFDPQLIETGRSSYLRICILGIAFHVPSIFAEKSFSKAPGSDFLEGGGGGGFSKMFAVWADFLLGRPYRFFELSQSIKKTVSVTFSDH